MLYVSASKEDSRFRTLGLVTHFPARGAICWYRNGKEIVITQGYCQERKLTMILQLKILKMSASDTNAQVKAIDHLHVHSWEHCRGNHIWITYLWKTCCPQIADFQFLFWMTSLYQGASFKQERPHVHLIVLVIWGFIITVYLSMALCPGEQAFHK